jgi:hypothetical protein
MHLFLLVGLILATSHLSPPPLPPTDNDDLREFVSAGMNQLRRPDLGRAILRHDASVFLSTLVHRNDEHREAAKALLLKA